MMENYRPAKGSHPFSSRMVYMIIFMAIITLSSLLYFLSWTEVIRVNMEARLSRYQINPMGENMIQHKTKLTENINFIRRNGSYCSRRHPFLPTSIKEFPLNRIPDIPIYFPVDEPHFCSDNPDLEVIAFVESTLPRIDERNITRQTWGSAYKNGIGLRVVFIVGRPKTAAEEKILHTESKLYHDMIQGNFTEGYQLVLYKTLSSMYWVSSRCSYVPWVLKIDDDMLIDPFLLHKLLSSAAEEGFNCYMWENGEVARRGLYAVTKEQWSDKTFPPFCAGAFVLHHQNLIPRILNASCQTPLKVWMEDVHVYGFLAGKAGGIKPKLQVLKHSHRDNGIKIQDLGHITSWFEIKNRTYWWEKIKEFHKVKKN